MKRQGNIKLGEVNIPKDYFLISKEEKEDVCNQIIDAMLTMIDKSLKPEVNRIVALDSMLQTSIITNQENENYELCQVLMDIRNLLNE